jgi:hypothetical protein
VPYPPTPQGFVCILWHFVGVCGVFVWFLVYSTGESSRRKTTSTTISRVTNTTTAAVMCYVISSMIQMASLHGAVRMLAKSYTNTQKIQIYKIYHIYIYIYIYI